MLFVPFPTYNTMQYCQICRGITYRKIYDLWQQKKEKNVIPDSFRGLAFAMFYETFSCNNNCRRHEYC